MFKQLHEYVLFAVMSEIRVIISSVIQYYFIPTLKYDSRFNPLGLISYPTVCIIISCIECPAIDIYGICSLQM